MRHLETLKYLGPFYEYTVGRANYSFMKHLLKVYLAPSRGRIRGPKGTLRKGSPCTQGAGSESGEINKDRMIWKNKGVEPRWRSNKGS